MVGEVFSGLDRYFGGYLTDPNPQTQFKGTEAVIILVDPRSSYSTMYLNDFWLMILRGSLGGVWQLSDNYHTFIKASQSISFTRHVMQDGQFPIASVQIFESMPYASVSYDVFFRSSFKTGSLKYLIMLNDKSLHAIIY